MNVLFAIRADCNLNGQIAQLELMAGLKKQVNLVVTGIFSDEIKHYLQNKSIRFIELYPQKKIDSNYIRKFSELLIKNNIDIVHFIDGKASRSGLIALRKFPEIKAITYFGSISLHWYDPTAYLTYLNPRIDAIIGNSNYVFNHVKKQLFRRNKKKAIRIFKGYNPEWFSDTKDFDFTSLNIPSDAVKVVSIGNYHQNKGVQYFLESFNFLNSDKEIHYILIGNTSKNPYVKKIISENKITHKVHIIGVRGDAPSLVKGADMYVQTSLSEGFGRAISEAMCLGKPIVMTNAGGCTELIDEHSGIVVSLKDSKAIGEAISKLADNDELRAQMGKNAKERITNVYHIDRTVTETLELYKKLMNE